MPSSGKVVCISKPQSADQEVDLLLGTAERTVEKLEQHLVSTGYRALAECDQALYEVQTTLTSVVALLRSNPAPEGQSVRHTAASLQRRVTRLSVMLEQANGFYATWLEALRSHRAGYGEDGRPVPADPPPRLSIES